MFFSSFSGFLLLCLLVFLFGSMDFWFFIFVLLIAIKFFLIASLSLYRFLGFLVLFMFCGVVRLFILSFLILGMSLFLFSVCFFFPIFHVFVCSSSSFLSFICPYL